MLTMEKGLKMAHSQAASGARLPIAVIGFTLMLTASGVQMTAKAPAPAVTNVEATVVVTRYCVPCHNKRLKTGNLTLEDVDLGAAPGHGEKLEKVIRKLRAGAMPPAGSARPDQSTYNGLVASLEAQL